MVSIIIVGRNDNYGGNFESHLFSTQIYNVNKLEKAGVEYEIIFVEWNPISSCDLLSLKIVEKFKRAICYVVDNSIHRYICANKYIAVYEYLAKNVGAKRAKGDWLLITNPDNYFGKDIVGFLGSGCFDSQALYRAGWINVQDEGDIDNSILEDQYKNDPAPFRCASGDFIFVNKELFDLVGSYREDLTFTGVHMDSISCLSIFDRTKKAYKIGNTYHLDHGRDHCSKCRLEYDFFKVPRTQQPEYGLVGISYEEKIADRIYKLSLIKRLRCKLIFKIMPEPRVPFKFRFRKQFIIKRLWNKIIGYFSRALF